jgi:hypothetical protein
MAFVFRIRTVVWDLVLVRGENEKGTDTQTQNAFVHSSKNHVLFFLHPFLKIRELFKMAGNFSFAVLFVIQSLCTSFGGDNEIQSPYTIGETRAFEKVI